MDTSINDFFRLCVNDINCNTSYPFKSEFFSEYRASGDIMEGVDELSFYYHIPFCSHLCSFCEYTRFLTGSAQQQKEYVDRLIRQSNRFIETHPIKKLYGLDIGGGTPTALDLRELDRLLDYTADISGKFSRAQSFEPSIEFSFSTIDKGKTESIASHGITRMSAGIQVFDKGLLESMNRADISLSKALKTAELIQNAGIKKLNIDIMYGFTAQTDIILKNTLYALKALHPQQITVYEMRYNRNDIEHNAIDRDYLFNQYSTLYYGIKELGYKGRFGQNTFSLYDDEGLSSYLYSRMYNATPYKGFGISAQSMSDKGITYNNLKKCKSRLIPDYDDIYEKDVYFLPPEELAAKYVCISLYSGRFSLTVLDRLLHCSAKEHFSNTFDYLIKNEYIKFENDDLCVLIENGFRYYGAVGALFWSDSHKEKYLRRKNEK